MRYFTLCFFSLCSVFLLSQCKREQAVDVAGEEKIFIMGNSGEPESLDPHVAKGVVESNIFRAIFEGLCADHPNKDGLSMPGAAESWEPNEDFTEWTFKLRKNGQWSDGTPLTSEDFMFSYERILSPAFAADYASILYFIDEAEEFNKGKIDDFSKVGVKAPDPHTLVLKLKAPTPFLPELTKHFAWFPVPKHAVLRKGTMSEQHTNWAEPGSIVSNGPFVLTKWQFTYKIETRKNPLYWDAANVKLNGVDFYPVSNEYTETRMFANGQLHRSFKLPAEMITYAEENYADSLVQESALASTFLRFNVTEPPFDNPLARKAISLVIQREPITENLLKGGQKPAYALTPPFGNYQPPKIVESNIELAKKTLREAGYDESNPFPKINILTSKKDSSVAMCEVIADMIKQNLGITVEIRKFERQTYFTEMENLNFNLGYGGWYGDYMDPTTFLDMFRTGDGNNRTGWSNKEYDELLEKATQIKDPAERLEALTTAESILLNAYPITPLYWDNRNYLVHPSVENWHPLLQGAQPYKHLDLK